MPRAYAVYQSDAVPITFQHPTQWIVEEIEDGLVLQSEADLITDDAFDMGALQFIFWRKFETLLDPVEYARLFVREFGPD